MKVGKVKRGFFFYLFIFLVLITGVLGTCVVIMLFNPGKSLLGFQYFNNNAKIEVTNTTDDSNTDLELGKIKYKEIEINAGPAEVIVENNQDYSRHCIMIINNSKGFIRTEDAQPFTYSVTRTGNEISGYNLIIDFESVLGFVNFSKDIKIIIHFADISAKGQVEVLNNFKDTNLKIVTTNGNVSIGGTVKTGYSTDIYPGSLDVQTNSGNISITKHGVNPSYKKLNLSTKSGIVNLLEYQDLSVVEDTIKVDVGDGKLKANTISETLEVTANNGEIKIAKVKGNVSIACASTIVNIGIIQGNLNFAESSEIMTDSKIYVDEVTGFVNVLEGRGSDFVIGKIGGNARIYTTSGNVKLGSKENLLYGTIYVETVSGQIDVFFGEALSKKTLITDKGNINTYFGEKFRGNQNSIYSKEGNVLVKFRGDSNIKFKFDIPNPTEDKKFDLKNVSFDILNNQGIKDNPFIFGDTKLITLPEIEIITNGKIVLDLISEVI